MRYGLLLLLLGVAAAAEPGFTDLFNGRNLKGWEEDTPNLWKVRDGMIVGASPGLKYNDFLRLKQHYGDFILKLSFRLINGDGNSGIQFRSKPVANSHEVSGYQADIGQRFWGCLYDEHRRRRVLVQPTPESLATIRKDGWNEYVITAVGSHITLDLNGMRTVDYHEEDSSVDRSGLIALQVHAGSAMEVQFKDIRIQEIRLAEK